MSQKQFSTPFVALAVQLYTFRIREKSSTASWPEHLYKINGKFTNNNVGGKVFDVPINLPVLLNIKSAHACDQNYPCKSEYIALRD